MSIYSDYYTKRADRLALQKQVDSLKQEEDDLMYEITKELNANSLFELKYDNFVVTRTVKPASNVTDWPALLEYIKATGSVDLLQKRVSESAVKLRWDAGVTLPGVDKTTKDSITVTKIG